MNDSSAHLGRDDLDVGGDPNEDGGEPKVETWGALSEDDVLVVAGAIRPFLPSLVGDAAGELDQQLDSLLARHQARDATVKVELLELLAERDATRSWTRQALAVPVAQRSFQPQPGQPKPASVLYACPRCGAQWYRFNVLDPIPICDLDQVQYEPVV